MAPTNLRCPCSSEPQPLDHWTAGQGCPHPPQARAWYHGGLQRTLEDTRHAGGNVTVTRLLGCPRQWLITDLLPYTYDPLSWHRARVGTLVQEEVARYAHAVGAQAEVKVEGKLFGLQVSGSIDLLAGSLINEGKFHGEKRMDALMGRAKWTKPPNVKQLLGDDYAAQMNMQRLLLLQRFEVADKLIISHSAMEDAAWPSERAPLRDEAWIGEVRPMSGSFTVRQIAAMINNFQANTNFDGAVQHEDIVRQAIKDCIPKVGESQLVNSKTGKSWMCEHCEVRRECEQIG